MKTKLISLFLLSAFFSALYGQTSYVNEDFNAGVLPSGWANTANTGIHVWEFGLDGSVDHPGNNNIDGTAMAHFDDSKHGVGSILDYASLETPVFNNSTSSATFLEFDYNFREFGSAPDSFYVEVFDGTSWNTVFSRTTNNCGNYLTCSSFPHVKLDISTHANTVCKVRFTYYDGGDWGWYVGVDNVRIYSPSTNDLGVFGFSSPESACGLTAAETVSVKIFNYGAVSQSNFPISYSLNGGAPVTETVSQTLNVNDSVIYTFSTPVNLSNVGVHVIDAWTGLVGDGVMSNDTSSTVVEHIFSYGLPYLESFENDNGGWTSYGTNSSWNRGRPIGLTINTAAHGNVIFATDTIGNYNSNELSYLESPCLDFSSAIGDPILAFSLFYDTEQPFDYLYVETSIDYGRTWTKFNGALNARNWYNNANSTNWTGNSGGWLNVETALTGMMGQSQSKIRFAFRSDASLNLNGIGIDHISIRSPQAIDMAVNELTHPSPSGLLECGLGMESITIEVENKGANTANSYIISYKVDGGVIESDTINNPLPSNATRAHIFSAPYDFSVVKGYSVDVWVEIGGDGFRLNDSINRSQINNNGNISKPVPYSNYFDRFFVGSVFSNIDDSINDGWTRSSTSSNLSSQYMWRVGVGTVNRSGGTGPDGDHTTNGHGGYFMYTEASFGSPGDVATLTSPCIDLSGSRGARMSFWYHRYGSQITTPIRIDVYDGVRWHNSYSQVIAKPQTSGISPWSYKEVDLNSFSGRKIKVRFSATSGGCCAGDMAIDDFRVLDSAGIAPFNVTLLNINGNSGCVDEHAQITVNLINEGDSTILPDSLVLGYLLDNNSIEYDTIRVPIAPKNTLNYTLSKTLQVAQLGSDLTIWTELNADTINNGDTLRVRLHREIKSIPYNEDFETMTDKYYNCWGLGVGIGSWKLGDSSHHAALYTVPHKDHTTNSSSGKYLYTNGISTPTIQRLSSSLIDLSTTSNAFLSFWYHLRQQSLGYLYVDIYPDANSSSYIRIDTIVGIHTSSSDPWGFYSADISNYSGDTIKVVLTGQNHSAWSFHLAIDDFLVDSRSPVGLKEKHAEDIIAVYPNPSDGLFYLTMEKTNPENTSLEVFNSQGQLILEKAIVEIVTPLDLSEYKHGIYFLRLNTGKEVLIKKIILQ